MTYQNYDLVVALANGRPCENRAIEKSFLELKEQLGLPRVVFHSLRHSSTTYKLKLNHGDLKATQGDTGHAEIDMITKVYAPNCPISKYTNPYRKYSKKECDVVAGKKKSRKPQK